MRTDLPETADKDRSPTRGFYRGRVTFVIERSLGKTRRPWLARGLVTFLSDAVVKDKEVQVGRMTAADGDGAGYRARRGRLLRDSEAADRRFDLLAGLFVHYLLVGDNGRNAAALDAPSRPSPKAAAPSSQAAFARVTSLYRAFRSTSRRRSSRRSNSRPIPRSRPLRSACGPFRSPKLSCCEPRFSSI